ncbi:MAG: hypothetical protein LBB98_09535 [Treponema sp.]|jgi:hypothetical protein|nr:hypothetical protein [Treponema sp.]
MTDQELRAASLQIAAQILGPLPPTNPVTGKETYADSPDNYKDYVWLAGHIAQYIEQGDGLLLKKQG